MDLYNIITKIPYILMIGMGTVIILQIYIGGLQDLSTNVDVTSEDEYRKAILLEKLINYDANLGEVDYIYDRRRAVMPKEIFTNENPEDSEIGHQKNGPNCYIEDIDGLDGQNFGFSISPAESTYRHASNPESLECTRSVGFTRNAVSSPVLIVRGDNPPLEARVYVYKIS